MHIELREDYSIIISPSAVDSALLFTSLCASGRRMEAVKQEIWSDQCEYLRNKVTAFGCQGYINRNIGTLISAPFENASRHDVNGQPATEVLYAAKIDGGLDCNLLPDSQLRLVTKLPPAPRLSKVPTRGTRDTTARGAADLATHRRVTTYWIIRSVLASEIHEQVTEGSALPAEISAAHREYGVKFAQWAKALDSQEAWPLHESRFLNLDYGWSIGEDNRPHSYWLVPQRAWMASYRKIEAPEPHMGWMPHVGRMHITFDREVCLSRFAYHRARVNEMFGVVNPDEFQLDVRNVDGWHYYVVHRGDPRGPIMISNQMNVLDVLGEAVVMLKLCYQTMHVANEWSDYLCHRIRMCISFPEHVQKLITWGDPIQDCLVKFRRTIEHISTINEMSELEALEVWSAMAGREGVGPPILMRGAQDDPKEWRAFFNNNKVTVPLSCATLAGPLLGSLTRRCMADAIICIGITFGLSKAAWALDESEIAFILLCYKFVRYPLLWGVTRN
ncbi:hypothetical protein V3C99_005172 [Haemonchus contortus]|uniref:RNA-directed RNA polymerase n=1 Tax=Haemonchus contortus TaxID=6289 RepID=A0A7I4XU96_HAECO